jgi:hypothetical protein
LLLVVEFEPLVRLPLCGRTLSRILCSDILILVKA